jgi:hypothetical protein
MDDLPKTLTVPAAGKEYFGLSRNASYAPPCAAIYPQLRLAGC